MAMDTVPMPMAVARIKDTAHVQPESVSGQQRLPSENASEPQHLKGPCKNTSKCSQIGSPKVTLSHHIQNSRELLRVPSSKLCLQMQTMNWAQKSELNYPKSHRHLKYNVSMTELLIPSLKSASSIFPYPSIQVRYTAIVSGVNSVT